MKKAFIVCLILLLSCGKDGNDGNAYLSFYWDWYVDSYWDDNPDIPSSINEGSNYNVSPGTFNYSYDCSDGLGSYWSYEGTYKIRKNYGEDGGFLKDGADGDDLYFILNLYGNGSTFSSNKSSNLKNKDYLESTQLNNDLYIKCLDGEMETFDFNFKGGSMTITRQKFILHPK